jgi:hypothetical protein
MLADTLLPVDWLRDSVTNVDPWYDRFVIHGTWLDRPMIPLISGWIRSASPLIPSISHVIKSDKTTIQSDSCSQNRLAGL